MNFHTYVLALALMGGWAGPLPAADIAIPKPLGYVQEGVYLRTFTNAFQATLGTNAFELSGGRFRQWAFRPGVGSSPGGGIRGTNRVAGSVLKSGTYTTNGSVAKLIFPSSPTLRGITNEYTCVEFEGRVMLYYSDPGPPERPRQDTNFSLSAAWKLTDRKLDDIIAGK